VFMGTLFACFIAVVSGGQVNRIERSIKLA
jgi:hypothetical protein